MHPVSVLWENERRRPRKGGMHRAHLGVYSGSLRKGMRQGILEKRSGVGNSGAVDGYGVAREHGTTKSDEGGVRRAELARATPRSNPKSE